MLKRFLFSFIILISILIPHQVFSEELPRNIQITVLIEKVGYETAYGEETTFSQKTQEFITTLEGYEGTIFVGNRISYVAEIKRYLAEHEYIDYAVVMTDVGTQLRVIPKIKGGQIELQITPEISYQTAQGDPESIQVHKLSTTMLIPNGQMVQLGSIVTDSEFFDFFYRNERGERISIYVTPKVSDPY